MTEQGTVVRIEKDLVTLKFEPREECNSCGSTFCSVKERVFTARNSHELSLQIGDSVVANLPTGKTIAAGFMALMLPLLLFVTFYLLSARLLQIPGEGIKVLFGTAGMGLGFGVTFLAKKIRKWGEYPEIIFVNSSNRRNSGEADQPNESSADLSSPAD